MTVNTSPISKTRYPTSDSVDVLLLLEGTFPFVAGGVSSWVNQIIRGFPDIRFGAVFLGSRPEDYGDMRYVLPDNLVHLQVAYIYGEHDTPPVAPVVADADTMAMVESVHTQFETNLRAPQCEHMFAQLMDEAGPDGKLSEEVFLYSKASWEYIKKSYRKHSTDPSFVDYFWTIRTIHAPFWRLREVALSCPKARVYHSVSTGYAGILGVLLKHRNQRPLMLSEHGIYVKERKIDLYQAQWLKDNRSVFDRDPSRVSYFRQLWIRFFEHLGYVTYQAANDIIALFEANRQRQLQDGAPPERTGNIPNGVDVARFAALRLQRPPVVPKVLCLIGRVVPIKDIKTFIRAMVTVVKHLPEAQAWIAGPEEEAPDYAQECRDLAAQLGLTDAVKFLGFQKLTDLLPKVGLVVLSSISEGLPLVILEGYAAGVPTVATDVGSCRQLVFGLPGEDAAFGTSGQVVRIADPEALAQAALALLGDEAAWHSASVAGIKRVEAYYAQDVMFARYRALYERNLQWQA
ncbi:MAG: GT4 family glycosyltransferase PelF [Rhodoferax sp.]|uniref:GT4 family glycosyltransferase PelF n=1 Tax=Rhodoferax sp. TaxID=50421 RepID=UPI00260CF097|nr:GT4 family glycosyltransferase PelF [Rhodoferax sp.]MDD2880083.1 GT4 family glycosyltransferase PelF [Rhodoferax sp.]